MLGWYYYYCFNTIFNFCCYDYVNCFYLNHDYWYGFNTNYYQPHYGFVLSEVHNNIVGTEISYIHYQPSYNNVRITDSLPDYQKFGFNIKNSEFVNKIIARNMIARIKTIKI